MSALPDVGRDPDDVIAELTAKRGADADWANGRTFGLVYDGGDEVHVAAGTYTRADNPNAYAPYQTLGLNGVVTLLNQKVAVLGGYSAANWNAAPDMGADVGWIMGLRPRDSAGAPNEADKSGACRSRPISCPTTSPS